MHTTLLPSGDVMCDGAQGFNLPAEGMWFYFEGMIDLFFYADLVLNFFTAYEVGEGGEQWDCVCCGGGGARRGPSARPAAGALLCPRTRTPLPAHAHTPIAV